MIVTANSSMESRRIAGCNRVVVVAADLAKNAVAVVDCHHGAIDDMPLVTASRTALRAG